MQQEHLLRCFTWKRDLVLGKKKISQFARKSCAWLGENAFPVRAVKVIRHFPYCSLTVIQISMKMRSNVPFKGRRERKKRSALLNDNKVLTHLVAERAIKRNEKNKKRLQVKPNIPRMASGSLVISPSIQPFHSPVNPTKSMVRTCISILW